MWRIRWKEEETERKGGCFRIADGAVAIGDDQSLSTQTSLHHKAT